MEEARKKKWASVALIIGAIGFIIIMIYFTVISSLNKIGRASCRERV